MRRPFVISTFALALALLPAVLLAQTPPPGQTPTQPPAQPTTPAQPAAPAEPKLGFTAPAGILLVQVKPDQTAAFEEMAAKFKASMPDAKIYKSAEGMGGNALYVVLVDPAKAATEYNPIDVLYNALTDEQKRDPATRDTLKRYADAFAGINKLNITPVGGGM